MIDEIQNFKNYLTQVITIDNKSFDMSIEYLKIERICKGEYFVKDGQV